MVDPTIGVRLSDSSTAESSQPRLRILHVLRALRPTSGGPLTHLESMVALLDPRYFEFRIATVEPCSPPSTVPAPVHSGAADAGELRRVIGLARWLAGALRDTDLVQIHGVFGWQLVLAAMLCRRAGVPYVVRPHGSLSPWFLTQGAVTKRWFLRTIGLSLLRRSRGLIAMTPTEADSLRALDPRLAVVRIYPGVALPRDIALGGATNPLRIVFLGRIAPVKNLPDLFRAMRILKDRGHAVALDVIGDGPGVYPQEMRRLARALDLSSEITFHGPRWGSEKEALMRKAQVLGLPSTQENFSHVTAEALALGLPVVVSDQVALAPLVERFGCGHVVPVGDVPALATALLAYRDEQNRSAASRAARACAEQCLSLQAMRESLERLYRAAADVRRPTAEPRSS